MKKAIIVGHTGQDGTYLWKLLSEKGYQLCGISSKCNTAGTEVTGHIDITKTADVNKLIKTCLPDEIYYLAAIHQSSTDKNEDEGSLFLKSVDVNVKGWINFLEGARKFSQKSRLFYASSSHIFGNPAEEIQTELSPVMPNCIYGITKAAGMHAGNFYREKHVLFVSCGILYNHESPKRDSKYVSRKIVETAVLIKKGLKNNLVLGNLNAKIDWGFAPDYMEAVHHIMQLEVPDNFIVSSGEKHSIREFAEGVFSYLGLDWKNYVVEDPSLIIKQQKKNLFGNSSKLRNATGWAPGVNFNKMIAILVQEELKKHG